MAEHAPIPHEPGWVPPGQPGYRPPCAYRYNFDAKDWRCACKAVFPSLEDLAAHVKSYTDAERDRRDDLRNQMHRARMRAWEEGRQLPSVLL